MQDDVGDRVVVELAEVGGQLDPPLADRARALERQVALVAQVRSRTVPLSFWALLVTIDSIAPMLSVKRGSPSWRVRTCRPSSVFAWRTELCSSVSVQLTLVYGPVTHGIVTLTDLMRRR